jgi:hypothetical protein
MAASKPQTHLSLLQDKDSNQIPTATPMFQGLATIEAHELILQPTGNGQIQESVL